MAQYQDKFYYVDPGIGSKKDGCPYSFFQDGQDVVDFIIPPEGYVFKGFRLEPYDEDPFYEGKIVAEYKEGEIKKEPIWKRYYIWVLYGIAAILFMVFAAYCIKHVAKKIRKRRLKKTVIDLTISDTTKIDTTTTDTTSFKGLIVAETEQQPSAVVEQTFQPKPIVKENNTGVTLVQFQEQFWSLVHQRTATMDDFHDLFVKYKKLVKCEEYEYLRLVILQNYATFKEWNRQMLLIPPEELQSINDIATLQEKIDIKI